MALGRGFQVVDDGCLIKRRFDCGERRSRRSAICRRTRGRGNAPGALKIARGTRPKRRSG
jgi:hypothetical protein